MANAPKEMRWHFIGRIQKNKISKLIGPFSLIHSVDTPELAKVISEKSLEKEIITPILLQSNTSHESSKAGFVPGEWVKAIETLLPLEGIKISGLMTMAPFTKEETILRACFSSLRKLKEEIEAKFSTSLPILSMGMSNDFQIAIEEGATHLRIGSALFNAL